MKAYLARDKNGWLQLFRRQPKRNEALGLWWDDDAQVLLSYINENEYEDGWFSEVTWEGGPVECDYWVDPDDGTFYVTLRQEGGKG